MKRYMNYGGRSFAAGGAMPMEQLTEFSEGGRHEENGLGGIPQGMNPEGQMNLVEEGETKFDSENYIYSDSLKIDKELAEAFNLNPKMVGKTFADASKMAGRKKSKREGDAIEMAANEKDLMNLMEAQEAFKQARIEEKLQEIAELDPNALPALMGQGQPQGDPAMGGQIQEAPMDEQAMMEQQMMAEQQAGGGQPSPEEMAMMQQQQDMAMGQQEGMMRSGGFTDPPSKLGNSNMYYNPVKPVLESMDFKMSTGAGPNMGMNEGFDITGGVTDELTDMGPAYLQSLKGTSNPAPNPMLNNIKNKSGGYMKRSYVSGGFMGMTNTLGDPPVNMSTSTRNSAEGDGDFTFKYPGIEMEKRNPINSFYENQGYQKEYIIDPNNPEVTQQVFIDPNNRKQAKLTKNREKMFRLAQKGKLPLVLGEYDSTYAMGGNLMQSGQEAGLNPMQGMNQLMRKGGKMCYGCGGKMHAYGGRLNGMNQNQMATGGEIVAGIGSGLYGIGEGLLDTLTFGLTDELTNKGYEKLKSIGPDAEGNAGDMIRGGANVAGAATGAVLTGGAATGAAISEGSEGIGDTLGAVGKQTGNDTYTKVGQGISGAGQIAGMLVGDASGAVGAAGKAGEVATKAGDVAGTSSQMVSKLGTVPEMFETAEMTANATNAAAKAAKAAEMTSKFNKVGEIAQNDAVQMGINAGTQALDASTQNAAQTEAQEFAAEQARKERERNILQSNRGYATGGYMGTRSYGTGGRPGLWANIQAKKKRMGSNYRPARPGEKDYPSNDAIKAAQNDMGGRLYNTGGPLTLTKNITNPDGTTIEQNVTYNSLEELLADTEMVNKYGGREATKQAFAARFKKNSNIPRAISDPINTIADQILNPEETAENPAMISYINKLKEQEELDRTQETENAINIMQENPEYMPQVKQLPIIPPGLLDMPKTQEMVLDPTLNTDATEIVEIPKTETKEVINTIKDDNEVDVDVDQADINRDFTFKESPGQFAAKMAAPMMNLYSGLFDKYDPKFEPEFQGITAPKLDYTESINSIRRNAAKIKRSFNKVGSNPGNLLAVSQQTNSLEAQAIQQIDTINAKLEFEGEKLNNAQKQRLEKTKKELQLGFEEAKRKSLQAAAEQFQQIATTNQANALAQQYAAMGAENIGKVEYKTLVEQLGDLLKKRKEKKNKKK